MPDRIDYMPLLAVLSLVTLSGCAIAFLAARIRYSPGESTTARGLKRAWRMAGRMGE